MLLGKIKGQEDNGDDAMQKLISTIKNLIAMRRQTRYEILQKLAAVILPEYRFKWPFLDWWDNAGFSNYLDRFDELGGSNSDRRWMVAQLLRLTYSVPGDTAECGVYKGASSYLIALFNSELVAGTRRHYMFDSFAGLSQPGDEDGSHWSDSDLSISQDTVAENLSGLEGVSFMPGWIPSRFHEVEQRRFSFVHIDVDLYQPTYDSIAFFYPRMNPGGVLICDDYGSTLCPGATSAIDRYLKGKPEKMLALCSGGGFLIKGCDTAPDTLFPLSIESRGGNETSMGT